MSTSNNLYFKGIRTGIKSSMSTGVFDNNDPTDIITFDVVLNGNSSSTLLTSAILPPNSVITSAVVTGSNLLNVGSTTFTFGIAGTSAGTTISSTGAIAGPLSVSAINAGFVTYAIDANATSSQFPITMLYNSANTNLTGTITLRLTVLTM
jgi:hypothetical protein